MNTSNVMSVPNATSGRGRTARGATEIKEKNGPGRGKGSAFDNVLAQSQEGSLTPKDRKDLADSVNSADKEIKAVEKVAEGTANGMDAGTASKNIGKQSGETVSGEEKGPEWSAGSVAAVNPLQLGALQTETESITAEESEVEVGIVKMDSEDVPMDWLADGKQAESPNGNLHSLLPPSEEQTVKNKQMLAMLSGQMVKESGPEEKPIHLSSQGQFAPLEDGASESRGFGQEKGLATQRFQSMEAVDSGRVQMPTDPLSAQSLQMAKNFPADGRISLPMEQLPQGNVMGQQMTEKVFDAAQSAEGTVMDALVTNQPAAANQGKQGQPAVQQESGILSGVQIEVEDVPVNSDRESQQQFAQQEQRQSQQQPQQQMFFQRFLARGSVASAEVQVPSGNDKGTAPAADGNAQSAPVFQQTMQHVNGAGQAGQSAPTSQVRDEFNVTQQIVEQARLIRSQESTEMVIRLRPEHLGELTLRVSVSSEGAVTASFFSDNAHVRHIVENSLVLLRQELENQGIKVDKAEVYAGLSDGQLPQEQGQQAWQQQGQGNSSTLLRSLNADVETFEETATDLSVMEDASEDSLEEGVNYLV